MDYFIAKANTSRPAACGSYEHFSSDTSYLKYVCSQWGHGGKWSVDGLPTENRLYSYPFFEAGKYHFMPHTERQECDDYIGFSPPVAVVQKGDYWKIYVR